MRHFKVSKQMPAHSCMAMWSGPTNSSRHASMDVSFMDASGPANEKSNLRPPSERAWNPRYRTVDLGSFMHISNRTVKVPSLFRKILFADSLKCGTDQVPTGLEETDWHTWSRHVDSFSSILEHPGVFRGVLLRHSIGNASAIDGGLSIASEQRRAQVSIESFLHVSVLGLGAFSTHVFATFASFRDPRCLFWLSRLLLKTRDCCRGVVRLMSAFLESAG